MAIRARTAPTTVMSIAAPMTRPFCKWPFSRTSATRSEMLSSGRLSRPPRRLHPQAADAGGIGHFAEAPFYGFPSRYAHVDEGFRSEIAGPGRRDFACPDYFPILLRPDHATDHRASGEGKHAKIDG